MTSEYLIYADESEKRGEYFSDFYGGALVRSRDIDRVVRRLEAQKNASGFGSELKWRNVSYHWSGQYIGMMDCLFNLVAADLLKIRIMFTQNRYVPTNLTPDQRRNSFILLYYQFLKHAFGLRYADDVGGRVRCRLYLDELPVTKERFVAFRRHLSALSLSPEFRQAGVFMDEQDIAQVKSEQHIVLQCLDVVLGAMQFRLNDKHKLKPPGSRKRGKSTIAKEKVYRAINARIRGIYPHFNIGESTGIGDDVSNRWRHPYRHWKFIPSERRLDPDRTKRKK